MSNLSEGLKEFNLKNYDHALKILVPIAEGGDAEAQCLIGNMYQLGLGIQLDLLSAIAWYEKSAQQGYGVASNNLGGIFQMGGEGVPTDLEKSSFWYQQAREQGFLHTPKQGAVDSLK